MLQSDAAPIRLRSQGRLRQTCACVGSRRRAVEMAEDDDNWSRRQVTTTSVFVGCCLRVGKRIPKGGADNTVDDEVLFVDVG